MSNIQTIRERVAKLPPISANKQAVRDFIIKHLPLMRYGITLTLKQNMRFSAGGTRINRNAYKFHKKLDVFEAAKAAENFTKRLNSRILKSRFKRYGDCVFTLAVLERGESGRLHLHLGAGNLPTHLSAWQFCKAVGYAARHTDWVDRQIDVAPAQCFFSDYLTKQVTRRDADVILFQQIPEA